MRGVVAQKPQVIQPLQQINREHYPVAQRLDSLLEVISRCDPLATELFERLADHDGGSDKAARGMTGYRLLKSPDNG